MKKLVLVFFLGMISNVYAIEVRPVDDSSAFCDKTDCVVSINYMSTLQKQLSDRQTALDAAYLENRALKLQISGGTSAPYTVPSAEHTQRMINEMWAINNAQQKQLAVLEAKCSNY